MPQEPRESPFQRRWQFGQEDKIVIRLDIIIANKCAVNIRSSGLQVLPINFFFKGIVQAEQKICIQWICQIHTSLPPSVRNQIAVTRSSSYAAFAEKMSSSESYFKTLDLRTLWQL